MNPAKSREPRESGEPRPLTRRAFQQGLGLGLTGLSAVNVVGGLMSGCSTWRAATPAPTVLLSAAGQGSWRGDEVPESVLVQPEPQWLQGMALPAVQEERWADNGLSLIVVPRPGLPLVGVSVMVRCGHLADLPAKHGTALLLAQMLSRGAVRRGKPVDAVGLARQAEALGSSVNTVVRDSLMSLDMTVTTPRVGAALALLVDMLRQPVLGAGELSALRLQARVAMALRLQDPAWLAALVARRVGWGRSLHGAVTSPESLARVRREDLLGMHKRWVRPDRVAVVLTGDIDMATARALAQPLLADWRVAADAPAVLPELPSLPPEPLLPATVLVHLPTATQSSVMVTAPFAALGAPERVAGQLAAGVISAGYSSRLNQDIRIRRGLSYGVSGRLEQQRAGGLLVTETLTEHRHAAEVAKLVRAQLLALAAQEPGTAELQARRAALWGDLARQLDTAAGWLAQIGEMWSQGQPLVQWLQWPGQLQAVTPAQVRDFARQYWREGALSTVIVGRLKGEDSMNFPDTSPDSGVLRLDANSLVLDSPLLHR